MRKQRPIIGITPSVSGGKIKVNSAYSDAIFAAGGIPFFLPYTTDAERLEEYSELDGIFFSGGVDVDPIRYGEQKLNDSVEIDEARDAFEFALFECVIKKQVPLLGVCRGIQFLNVAMGGSLYQDIPDHRQSGPQRSAEQHIKTVPGSKIRNLMGKENVINTFHHQAVKAVADDLRVTATADDGTVEALELKPESDDFKKGRFFLAVQWHPEGLAYDNADHAAIFREFVEAAKKYASEI